MNTDSSSSSDIDTTMSKKDDSLEDISKNLKLLTLEIAKIKDSMTKNFDFLATENAKRSDEIKILAANLERLNDAVFTGDDTSINTGISKTRLNRSTRPCPEDSGPIFVEQPRDCPSNEDTRLLIPAKHIIETIETLRGRDDIGVEDFIRQVQKAKVRCSQPHLLLDLILATKIIEGAKRSIRYLQIESYTCLFQALRQNVNPGISVNNCRIRLNNLKQQQNESIQDFNMKFRRQFNELQYAIQYKHSHVTARNIALENEEGNALQLYLTNVRPDIGNILYAKNAKTLHEAQNYACEIESFLKNRKPTIPKLINDKPLLKKLIPLNSFKQLHNESGQQKSPLKCMNCGKIGHTKERCFNQNFMRAQTGKIPPQRVNQLEKIEEDHRTEETEYHELTPHMEDFDTLKQNYSEWKDEEDCSWTPDPESA